MQTSAPTQQGGHMSNRNGYKSNVLPQNKQYLPLVKAVREATGTSPHLSTILRWCTKGARGRTLAHVLVGGRKMTTVEDVLAFVQVFDATSTPPVNCVHHRVPSDRTNAIDRAVLDLNKLVGGN